MTESAEALPPETRIGRVSLRVNDVERTARFYESVVGLETRSRTDGHARLGTGDETLLALEADPDAPERGPDETGLFHTAFRLPSRAALGDALDRIEDRWRLDGASDHLVSEALYLTDPEDNGVEVYRDRPRGEWPNTEDGSAGMDTLPLDLEGIRSFGSGRTTAPDATSVGHVHLEVSSLDAARAFYVDALGMRVRQAFGASALFVAAGDYHHHVGLNTWNHRTVPATGRGLDRFEVVVPDDATLTAARERLTAHGVDVEETESGLVATDGDGIRIVLTT